MRRRRTRRPRGSDARSWLLIKLAPSGPVSRSPVSRHSRQEQRRLGHPAEKRGYGDPRRRKAACWPVRTARIRTSGHAEPLNATKTARKQSHEKGSPQRSRPGKGAGKTTTKHETRKKIQPRQAGERRTIDGDHRENVWKEEDSSFQKKKDLKSLCGLCVYVVTRQ